MVEHALARGYDVVGVCRKASVGKLDEFKNRLTIVPAPTWGYHGNDSIITERLSLPGIRCKHG
jgi:hypothetical protein